MEQEAESFAVLVGVDWGSEFHEVCAIAAGKVARRKRFAHSSAGIDEMISFLAGLSSEGSVAVAIEVSTRAGSREPSRRRLRCLLDSMVP